MAEKGGWRLSIRKVTTVQSRKTRASVWGGNARRGIPGAGAGEVVDLSVVLGQSLPGVTGWVCPIAGSRKGSERRTLPATKDVSP